ncbi:hypothetical protein [Campylobacter geochelonis]|uniref:Uncharacterized protein n=1 Tax=Campylobacter geochelonis TaxID=1780362 RepID=A0A128EMS2_9BACT|nr:hypothetical protein [Campylobacter geochelonis]QKF72151.1 hypothetical protein CGEO_1885 [Campylobacter geochelonis]CZE46624.1 Uncharacterised protein [Campylobacter geochelonis]CZE49765.1 Uncharacterised protein [Campylobacter geochelonis]
MAKSRFYIKISQNLDKENLALYILQTAQDESLECFRGKSLEEKKLEAVKLFSGFCDDLESLGLLDKQNAKNILMGVKKAITKDEEEYLYKLLYESDKIKKQIEEQGREIKNSISSSLKSIENDIKSKEITHKGEILSAINEMLVSEVQLRDVIKEVCESVFVSIIEDGVDIEESARESSKNMVYKIILESGFSKNYAIEISKIIIKEAISVANLSSAYADELVSGVVDGANDGIVKAMEKTKSKCKFAPSQEYSECNEVQKEFLGVDEAFVLMLKELANLSQNPSKEILETILKKDYNNYFAKMKRLSNDASEQIKARLEQIDMGENYKELSKFVATKFDDIKKDISAKGSKIIDDFDLDDKFANFKKEIEEIEKKISSKFSEFKKKKIEPHTKELADRTYEATKEIVKEKKEKTPDEQ